MPRAKLAPDKIDAIKAAPFDESHESLAARLGISVGTVRNYRKELREERQEATKGRIAEHAIAHVTDALTDLTTLRTLARDEFKSERNPKMGSLWLDSIKTELAVSAGQDKPAEFDELTDEELKAVAQEALG